MSMTVLPTAPHPAGGQVDLWVELDRLSRADRAILAQRWDDVRRSRMARRRRAAHITAPDTEHIPAS